MPNYSDLFGGRFISAQDIDQPFTATVKRVEIAEMQNDSGGTKKRPVVFMEDKEKAIVLNAARYDFLAKLARSRNTDDWSGIKFGVRRWKTNFAGKRVDCVEICSPTSLDMQDDEASL
jgi:hypothetical protein